MGSDANKSAATTAGGLAVLAHVVRAFDARAADANATDAEKRRCRAAQEQCVGALAAACLKNPEGAARLGPEGCVDAVFDAMAAFGSSDARAMAAGVSKATIPTMAGMVAALSGVFCSTWLNRKAQHELHLLDESLTTDH